jgi:ribose/xylose/arabinose/galactoside ABC-type transport system permease subunit
MLEKVGRKKFNFAVSLRRYAVLATLVLLFSIFASIERSFSDAQNIFNILRQASVLGLLALGLTCIVSVGEFDISFAAVSTFCGVLSISLLMHGVNLYAAWMISIVAGVALGCLNGFDVVVLGMPSFIATLGLQSIMFGVSLYITAGTTLYAAVYPAGFEAIGRSFIFGIIPSPVIWFLLFGVLGILFLEFSRTGRYIYSVGGNPEAATHVGIDVRRIKFISFVIMGLLCGVAGVVMASMFGSGNPSMGDGYLSPAIIATFLGAVFLKDGLTNSRGTIVACLVLAVLQNGFVMTNVPYFMKDIVQGFVLLIAVGMVSVLKKQAAEGGKL